MGILSNSPLSILGDSYKLQKDGLQYSFGVPQGCIVRNTFLEWQEPDEKSPEPARQSRPVENAQGPLRRARSCPREIEMSKIRPLAHDAQNGENCEHYCRRDALSASAPATPAYAWGDSDQEKAWQEGEPFAPTRNSSPESYTQGQGQQQKAQKSRGGGTSLVLRGLPFNVTEADVMAFIEQAGCAKALARNDSITLLTNQQGRPSGFAELQLNRASDFWEVQEKLHMQRLGTRYVEALPPRGGKAGWGMSTTRQVKRDSWRRVKGQPQPGDGSTRWHQANNQASEWAGYF